MKRISIGRIAGALAAVALVVGLAFRVRLWPELRHAGARTPRAGAAMLIQAVANWRSSHGATTCPSLAELRAGAELDPSEPLPTDPWHHQYLIECAGDAVKVRAPGPDGKANTLDDLLMTH